MPPLPPGPRFPHTKPVDFVVVGAGAAGGVVARELSRAGLSVVVLEQGPFLRETDFKHDEVAVMQLESLTNNHREHPNTFRTSVVDRWNRTHDVPNLFLVDGSSFVTSGRGQPTMTIQALAFRAAEHAALMARRGELGAARARRG